MKDLLATDGAARALVGNKAAALGELRARGVVVPDGLVVTTTAHTRHLAESGLRDQVQARVQALEDGEEALAEGATSPALGEALWAALAPGVEEFLGRHPAVILRSSATVEDSEAASLAGTFHSVGPLQTPAEVRAALAELWGRAAHTPALAAVALSGADPRRARVAGLLQPYLALDQFAVLASHDPRDPDGEPLVEVVDGAGEDLTAGRRSPRPARPGERGRLGALARRLASLRGGPTEAEVGIVRGLAVVLQARPLLLAASMRADIPWSREVTRERYPAPLSPLGADNVRLVFPRALRRFLAFLGRPEVAEDEVACVLDHRIHANAALFDVGSRLRPRPGLRGLLGALGAALRRVVTGGRPLRDLASIVEVLRGPGADHPLGRDPQGAGVVLAAGAVVAWVEGARQRWIGDWAATQARFVAAVRAAEEVDPAQASVDELEQAGLALRAALAEFLEPDLVIFVLREVCAQLVVALFRLVGDPDPQQALARRAAVLASNPTTEMNRELVALAEAGGDLQDFLARYGHLNTSWDLREPTLGEQQEELAVLVAGYRQASPRAPPPVGEEVAPLQGPPAAQQAYAWLVQSLRTLMRMDEEHHLLTARVLPATRRLVLELGRRLVQQGALAQVDDVFFLTDAEVWATLRGPFPPPRRLLVARRRAGFEAALARGEPGDAALGDDGWAGVPASVGRVRGPARRVATLADAARVQPGEVLVVRNPDPTWSVAFPVAAALVAETGGLLSHGVVAAREYGLPAVTGVRGVFDAVRDGECLLVDGRAGRVQRAEDAP